MPQTQKHKDEFDLTGAIMAYEEGTASVSESLELFAHLIRTGMAWTLQGCYGRTAAALIERGIITRKGEITEKAYSILEN